MWCSTSVPHRSITKPRWNKNPALGFFFLSSFCSTNYQRYSCKYSEPTWTTNGCKWVCFYYRHSEILNGRWMWLSSQIAAPPTSSCICLMGLSPEAENLLRIFPLSLTLSSSLSKTRLSKCHGGLQRHISKAYPLSYSFFSVCIQNSFVNVNFKVDLGTWTEYMQNKWGPVIWLIWVRLCGGAVCKWQCLYINFIKNITSCVISPGE